MSLLQTIYQILVRRPSTELKSCAIVFKPADF